MNLIHPWLSPQFTQFLRPAEIPPFSSTPISSALEAIETLRGFERRSSEYHETFSRLLPAFKDELSRLSTLDTTSQSTERVAELGQMIPFCESLKQDAENKLAEIRSLIGRLSQQTQSREPIFPIVPVSLPHNASVLSIPGPTPSTKRELTDKKVPLNKRQKTQLGKLRPYSNPSGFLSILENVYPPGTLVQCRAFENKGQEAKIVSYELVDSKIKIRITLSDKNESATVSPSDLFYVPEEGTEILVKNITNKLDTYFRRTVKSAHFSESGQVLKIETESADPNKIGYLDRGFYQVSSLGSLFPLTPFIKSQIQECEVEHPFAGTALTNYYFMNKPQQGQKSTEERM